MKSFLQAKREEAQARRDTEHNNRIERDRAIGQVYTWCECGYEASRSQYGCDDVCPRCGAVIDWTERHTLKGGGIIV